MRVSASKPRQEGGRATRKASAVGRAGAAQRIEVAKRTNVSLAPKRERAREPKDFKSSVVTIRVKSQLKEDATRTLAGIGISLPEAVRVFLNRVVSDGGFPFHLKVPNAVTRAAMREADGLSGRFATAGKLFDDLEDDGES